MIEAGALLAYLFAAGAAYRLLPALMPQIHKTDRLGYAFFWVVTLPVYLGIKAVEDVSARIELAQELEDEAKKELSETSAGAKGIASRP